MNKEIYNKYEQRAKIMKALGHQTRLFLVDELSKGERCVYELTEMVGADTSTISKHLSILREAGIVEYEKKGTQAYYRLAAPCVLNFFQCMETLLKTNIQKQLSNL